MINIENLTFTYPGAEDSILKNISLQVEKGDFLAIIGNNGCGKSTLCKTLNGLIPHFIVGDMQGSIKIDGKDTAQMEIGELAQKVGYVYQDFENQIVCPTVLEDAYFSCLNYAVEDYRERGRKALEMCGLKNKVDDYVWQMSGGQKHLLALAGMTALSPEVLILDEPIAQLDPAHARQIYDILKELNEVHGKTIIVIEHHTEFIADYCKHAVLMQEGKIKWKLPAKDAMSRVEELEESNIFPPQVTTAAFQMRYMGLLKTGQRLPTTLEEGRNLFEKLRWKERESAVKREEKLETVLQFQKVGVQYRAVKGKNFQIMQDFSLDIHRGEKIALIGSNGAGKSTLMKLMTGMLKPSEGQVLLREKTVNDCRPEEISGIISLVYQNPEEMFIKDSIRKDIEYAMKIRAVEQYEQRTQELLEMFRLTELADRDGRLLSGGQMRRASLAVGIALNPQILLLDEPTANLDIATRKEIICTLEELKDITETVVIATHDMQLVCDWAERIIVLSGGKLIADGTKEEIFADSYIKEIVGICPPEIVEMGQCLGMQTPCFTIDDFVARFQSA